MGSNSGLNLNKDTATCVSSILKGIFCITSSAIAETGNSWHLKPLLKQNWIPPFHKTPFLFIRDAQETNWNWTPFSKNPKVTRAVHCRRNSRRNARIYRFQIGYIRIQYRLFAERKVCCGIYVDDVLVHKDRINRD